MSNITVYRRKSIVYRSTSPHYSLSLAIEDMGSGVSSYQLVSMELSDRGFKFHLRNSKFGTMGASYGNKFSYQTMGPRIL